MKLHIIRLGSIVAGGVGGPEAGAIDLIYSFLLQEYCSDVYGHIHINQIGEDLKEVILKEGKKIKLNIRFPTVGFEKMDPKQRNLVRLNIIHTALIRIAEKESKLDKNILERIKNRIIENNFEFDFLLRKYENKKHQLTGKLIIHPHHDKFSFYFCIEKNSIQICKILIYEGKCTDYYIPLLFHSGKWSSADEFILMDKGKEFEIKIFLTNCNAQLTNLTEYGSPPFYEMMKAGNTKTEAYEDWLHSLPPDQAATITFNAN